MFLAIWVYRIWCFRCPMQNSKTTFQYKLAPKTPKKTPQEPESALKKWFLAILRFLIFLCHFLISTGHFFQNYFHQKLTPAKKENFSRLLKHLNQRKNTSPLTNFHFYYFQPYLPPRVILVGASGPPRCEPECSTKFNQCSTNLGHLGSPMAK